MHRPAFHRHISRLALFAMLLLALAPSVSRLLAGLVWERGQSLGLKLGVGAERTEDGDYEPLLHLGLILRLRGE